MFPRIILDKDNKTNEYYNPQNVCDNVGYWNQEIYRFGIVYIFNNNTLSPVFNILGVNGLSNEKYLIIDSNNDKYKIYRGDTSERAYLAYDEVSHILQDPSLKIYNNMGVTRIDLKDCHRDVPIKLGFSFFDFEHIKQELLNMGIVGYFIVRQKRLPTILAQAMVLNISKNMRLPLIGDEICKVTD